MAKKRLLLLLLLYVVSTSVSFAGFSLMHGESAEQQLVGKDSNADTAADEAANENNLLTLNPKDSRDQVCPLNGKLYTQTEREAWEKRRPLAVMIENHPEARPQSGFSQADVVFEAMAEGGVTRMMAMFYCDAQLREVTLAPVRSARTYFIDWASGFNLPLYVHVGGANVAGPSDALGQISDYGWVGQNDLNQFSIGYPTFVRDYNRIEGKDVATEHTMVTTTEKLWAVGVKRKWTNLTPERRVSRKVVPAQDWKEGFIPWSFQDGKQSGTTSQISFDFWDGFAQYGVKWEYDAASNSYKRVMAGEAHLDLNNGQQIMAKNAVVLLTDEKGPINDHKHMLYQTTGTGDALIFQNGEVIKAKWNKKTREAQLTFTNAKGQAVEFVRGLTWISVVSKKTVVAY